MPALTKKQKAILTTNFVINYLSDDKNFRSTVERLSLEFKRFWLEGNRQARFFQLREKMTKGAKEHRSPSPDDLIKIGLELENEFLDLVGWDGLKRYTLREMENNLNYENTK